MRKIIEKLKKILLEKNSSGQAILTVILVMVVALTIGLSISGRSITDLKISTQIEESQRAFSAAEAGIEAALYSGQSGTSTIGNASYTVKIEESSGGSFVYPSLLPHDEFAQIWLVKPDEPDIELYPSDILKIAWGNRNSNWEDDESKYTPAIEVIFIYKDGDDYKFGKYALDPREDRADINGFCDPESSCSGVSKFKTNGNGITVNNSSLQFNAELDLKEFRGLGKNLILLRARLIYNENEQLFAVIGVNNSDIPPQGKLIKSTGVAGNTTRKVQVFDFYPTTPSIFSFGLFSVGNLIKE